ncbi:hypothetical protein Tco_1456838 [Tanacetum coccineum]
MSSQTLSGLGVDEETREGLKDTIALLMREEMEKLRDEMRKCSKEFDLLKWDPKRYPTTEDHTRYQELVALRNFPKKDIDQDSVHMVAASKVPMLKQKVVEGVETIIAPATAEEKAQRRKLEKKLPENGTVDHWELIRSKGGPCDGFWIMIGVSSQKEGPKTFALNAYSSTVLTLSEPTVKKCVVETSEAKASKAKTKIVRKNNGAPIIEDWVSDNEERRWPTG